MPGILTRIAGRLNGARLRLAGGGVHPTSRVSPSADITNPGNLSIAGNCVIYKNVTIYIGREGRFTMGRHSHIAPYGYLLIEDNLLEIGCDVAVGPFCSFFCRSNHPLPDPLFRKNRIDADMRIGSNVFIGSHCCLLPGTTVGDNVVVGANSVVHGELESGWLYAGSPAKPLRRIP